ncbi:hypothetical protein [Herbidospora yilanensis]|uniref:hypothetical protein n=1 Tax=Herbidospora yilanensis TaxID=354426 RepID=UPI0012F784A3|nr:hypothetical protein [Herbidospora yilanensis]
MAVLPAAMLVLVVWALWALDDRLPDVVAVHFLDGRPEHAAPLWPMIGEVTVTTIEIGSTLALLAYLRPPGSIGQRLLAGGVTALTAMVMCGVVVCPLAANLDVTDWRLARPMSGGEYITVAVGAAAFALGAVAVYPLLRDSGPPAELSPDPIPSQIGAYRGRTAWIGQSRNPEFVRKTLATTGVLALLALVSTYWLVLPALASLATLNLWGGILLTFDGRRLSIRGRVCPWAIWRIPLRQIETAEVIEVDPSDWGGWGWRVRSLKRHAVIIRKGPALLVALRGGGELIVTVDDAATGAEEIRKALRGNTRPRLPRRSLSAYRRVGAQDSGRPPV